MGTFLSLKSRAAKSSLPYKNLNYISFILDWCDAKQKKYLLCKPADWQQANNICFCIFIKVECVTYRKSWSTGVTKDLALVASLPRSDCRSQCHFYCQWLPLQRLQETHRSLRTTPCLVIKSSWLLHSYIQCENLLFTSFVEMRHSATDELTNLLLVIDVALCNILYKHAKCDIEKATIVMQTKKWPCWYYTFSFVNWNLQQSVQNVEIWQILWCHQFIKLCILLVPTSQL